MNLTKPELERKQIKGMGQWHNEMINSIKLTQTGRYCRFQRQSER